MASKSLDLDFNTDWEKAIAWSQSVGIPKTAIAPVLSLDQQRLANGDYPMSAAERNRALLAAANPNNVTPAASDKPHPSAVFSNARRDLGMIATGLEPQHLIGGIFHSIADTVEGVVDPKKLEGKNLGATVGNWLQDTVLSFIPGAADLGDIARYGTVGGLKALADDPLVAGLDLMGATKMLTAGIAGSALAADLAERAGLDAPQFAKAGVPKVLRNVLLNAPTGSWGTRETFLPLPGVSPDTPISIGDWLDYKLTNARFPGVSGTIQQLGRERVINRQAATRDLRSIMGKPTAALRAIADAPEKLAMVNDIFNRNNRGSYDAQGNWVSPMDMQTLLAAAPSDVREAVLSLYDTLRFPRTEAVVSEEIAPLRRPDGKVVLVGLRDKPPEVLTARDALKTARESYLAVDQDAADLADRYATLTQARLARAGVLSQATQATRDAMSTDATLLDPNILWEDVDGKKPARISFGSKKDAADAVFGEGGMSDQLVKALQAGDVDRAEFLVKALDERTAAWGKNSVDVASLRDPAFQAVREQTTAIRGYLKAQRDIERQIDGSIIGSYKDMRDELADRRAASAEAREQMKADQGDELRNLRQTRNARLGKITTDMKLKFADFRQLEQHLKFLNLELRRNALNYGTDADYLRATEQSKLDDIKTRMAKMASKKQIRREAAIEIERVKSKYEIDYRDMKTRHAQEEADLRAEFDNQRMLEGPVVQEMRGYYTALRSFHNAVWNYVSDEYRDIEVDLRQKHLIEADRTGELTDHALRDFDKTTQTTLRQDPQIIGELLDAAISDVLKNPDPNLWDPNLVQAMQEASDEATKSGMTELKTLIAQGYKPEWVPALEATRDPVSAIKTMVGKGTPKLDIAHVRAHVMTPVRFDLALAVNHAVAQRLTIDAQIELLSEHIAPLAKTATDLQKWIHTVKGLEGFDPEKARLTGYYSRELKKLGLVKFNVKGHFGFTLPKWETAAGDEVPLYLPAGLAHALEKWSDQESGHIGFGPLDKATNLFRFSILGLSPRFTAHILFGGAFLLGLRSTPYLPSILLKTAKALRDGSIPDEAFVRQTQEGVDAYREALETFNKEAMNDGAKWAGQEIIEKTYGIAMSKASPIHWLKALGDMNFRFTRYVSHMQQALAYMDYFSSAERKGTFVDPVTGEEIAMLKERAMKEAMHHVVSVFGDLRSMAPIERTIAQSVMPFYGWTRHILHYVLSFPVDHPFRTVVLSQVAWNNSNNVPKGLPERIQLLLFLGSPDANGNVDTIDTRFMDPLRDVANYASVGGWISALNPAIAAPLTLAFGQQAVYGSSSLYPNVTYDQFYGIEVAGSQGTPIGALEQFVPQIGALQQAVDAATQLRGLAGSNKEAVIKSIWNDLNLPGFPQSINVKQIAAQDEERRYEIAYSAAENAFDAPGMQGSGILNALQGYSSVPNPLNPDYEATPEELQAVYNQALVDYPGQNPADVLIAPPTPSGF